MRLRSSVVYLLFFGSLLRGAAAGDLPDYDHYLRGTEALARGDGAEALRSFAAITDRFPASRWRMVTERLVPMATAAAAIERGDATTAEAIYLEQYAEAKFPGDVAAVMEGLALFRARFGRDPLSVLPLPRRVAIAKAFLKRFLAAEAAALLAPVAMHRASPELRKLLAEAYFQARDYIHAAGEFCRLADTAASGGGLLALLRSCATATARAGDVTRAIELNDRIIALAPRSEAAAVAQYKNAFLYLDTGRYGKAVNAYSAWLDRKRSSEGETLHARWAIAWCHYLQQEWQAALSAFDSVRLATGNPTWRARATYWRARTFEAMGHTAEAADLYDQVTAIAGGGGYYQALAAARRAGKAVDSLTAGKTPRRWQDRFGGSVAVAAMYADDRSRLLARRGQWALALEEAALAGSADDIELWMERLGKGWGVAPELVHLLIQRESGYRGDAISRTGALGLLQLMPATAAQVAADVGLPGFYPTDLYRPLTSLWMGMWHLRGLMKRYEGVTAFVLAAYNAGAEAVDRWIVLFHQRRGDGAPFDMEEFIEEIPYAETLHYVRAILGRYWSAK